jgi:hypothetical protein
VWVLVLRRGNAGGVETCGDKGGLTRLGMLVGDDGKTLFDGGEGIEEESVLSLEEDCRTCAA